MRGLSRTALIFSLLIISLVTGNKDRAGAAVFIPVQDALQQAFPEADSIVRKTIYLRKEQVKEAARITSSRVESISSLLIRYDAVKSGKPLGSAYIDTHRVRSENQTLMIVVSPDSKVRNILFLASNEIRDFHPQASWLGRFSGTGLDSLNSNRKIDIITGASLTSVSVIDAVRRTLALHIVSHIGP